MKPKKKKVPSSIKSYKVKFNDIGGWSEGR